METVKQLWDGYAAKILAPMNVSETQYMETRRAFYAGSFCMLMACQRLGEASISEDAGVDYLQARHDEIIHFYEDVKAGRA